MACTCTRCLGTGPVQMHDAPSTQSYSLRLRGIRFQGHIGASREERAVAQEILVDVDVHLPVQMLPKLDALEEVLSYDLVACCVVDAGVAQPYRLLETYVDRVATSLLEQTRALSVRVAATKRHVPTTHPVDSAIVEVVRTR